MKALFRALVMVAAVLAASVGCTTDTPETVVLVTYSGYALPADAAAAFRAETGYRIELRAAGDAGEALNRAILTSGRPEGDVFFGVDNTFLGRAVGSDAFSPYRSKVADGLPGDLRLDRTGVFTPIDTGDVCVDADASWFAEHRLAVPTTLDDLADPRYKDLLVVQDPARSSPGLAFLAGTHSVFGDRADDYWKRLKANGVAVSPSWDDAYSTRYTVNGGDRPLVVSYASSPPAEVVFADPPIESPASTVVTSTCVRQVEFAAVLRGASHPEIARRLVDFMLSPKWQAALPLSNFVNPAVRSTPLPEVFTRFSPTIANPVTLDPSVVGRERDQWIAAWRDVMQ